jgi:hypothetical protein
LTIVQTLDTRAYAARAWWWQLALGPPASQAPQLATRLSPTQTNLHYGHAALYYTTTPAIGDSLLLNSDYVSSEIEFACLLCFLFMFLCCVLYVILRQFYIPVIPVAFGFICQRHSAFRS